MTHGEEQDGKEQHDGSDACCLVGFQSVYYSVKCKVISVYYTCTWVLVTSGARSAERVYFYIPEKSQYERPAGRPAGRPAVVTLFERLFLWNGMTNSRTVIVIRCHHPINHVFDRYRHPPVPATARGTCRGEGVEDTLSLGNSTTAGPITFKFGV